MADIHTQAQFTGIRPSFFLYFGMASIALLKDLLDFVGIGSLPGVGTIVTLCFSFLIWTLMTLFDRSGGKSNSKMMRSLVFSLFSLFEAIGFGLNFLPIETLSVFFLYIMAKKAAKKEEKRLAGVKKVQTNAQQIREYQMARARAAVEESERLAEYQAQEAANEATFTENGVRKRA